MATDFVIGLDSSTQSTKAIAWSRAGEALAEGRADIPMFHPADEHFEQEPDDWWTACRAALKELGEGIDLANASAIAISNQRETSGFVDPHGASVRPALVWLDERAVSLMRPFADAFGAKELHRITGKPMDATPAIYRLYWMRVNEPDNLDRTAAIVDVHGFLSGKLTGKITATWTSADPFGIFDLSEKVWSRPVLEALEILPGQLPDAVQPGQQIGTVTADAASQTGLSEGLPLYAAGGDGQCAGLGANAVREGTAYLNLGTALILGAWDTKPRISLSWRTMSSPTGEGYFLEGAMRAGTYFVDWFVKNTVDPEPSAETFAELEAEAAAIAVGSEGLLVSPFLSGCMNPHWSMEARAAFFGLRPSHKRGHLYRAVLESITGWIARSIRDMKREGVSVDTIVAVGGGANSTLWLKMIADATGLPIQISNTIEASSLGAGMIAATGAGWYPDMHAAAEAMGNARDAAAPSGDDRAAWDDLSDRQERLDRLVVAESALTQVSKGVR
ncbi:MAG: xylulose kinase [Hyphomicrobiales bacterium]|nr:xylulose kinase [Hyphomicrobiales bacterium]